MADGTPSLELPAGATSIVRDAQSATTLYTVPTGFRLHIVSCWLTCVGAATTGSWAIQTTPEGDSTRNILRADSSAITMNPALAISHVDIPVAAASTVATVTSGTAPTSLNAGFAGWIEALTK